MQFIDQGYGTHKLTLGRNDADVLAHLFELYLDGLEPTPHSITLGFTLCEQIRALLDEMSSNITSGGSVKRYHQMHEKKLAAIYSNSIVRLRS